MYLKKKQKKNLKHTSSPDADEDVDAEARLTTVALYELSFRPAKTVVMITLFKTVTLP